MGAMVKAADISPQRRPGRRVLRPHQVKGRDAAARHLRRPGTRGLFVSATGTGKDGQLERLRPGAGRQRLWFARACPEGRTHQSSGEVGQRGGGRFGRHPSRLGLVWRVGRLAGCGRDRCGE